LEKYYRCFDMGLKLEGKRFVCFKKKRLTIIVVGAVVIYDALYLSYYKKPFMD
jgi:hypothetical protein